MRFEPAHLRGHSKDPCGGFKPAQCVLACRDSVEGESGPYACNDPEVSANDRPSSVDDLTTTDLGSQTGAYGRKCTGEKRSCRRKWPTPALFVRLAVLLAVTVLFCALGLSVADVLGSPAAGHCA